MSDYWTNFLNNQRQLPYYRAIEQHLHNDAQQGRIYYPPRKEIFNALHLTPYESTKVVIIGQDPYHGANQAHGLAFSVKPNTPAPPSLKNILKELSNDLGLSTPPHGCLENWTKQGVLLLNTSLTVQAGAPLSHAKIGWQQLTDQIITELNYLPNPIIYLLWGKLAQSKEALIDTQKHCILKAPHPSPLSAHRGFIGCKHFSIANALLKKYNRGIIDWQL